MHFTMGGMAEALDLPLDLVFERAALHRFVGLASEMLAAAEPRPRR